MSLTPGESADPTRHPRVSVLIGTWGRGATVAPAVASVLSSDHPSFELVVVDQNDDDTTGAALDPFRADPRLIYQKSKTKGSGRARNAAVALARGDYLAFTDDDCTVPPEWLQTIEKIFDDNERVGVVFCNVIAGEFDKAAGFIPDYVREGDALVSNMRQKCRARGIGAGMAVRRTALVDVGGFDNLLGPGARFPGYVDGDVAVRSVLRGWQIYETDRVAVIHNGFRSWDQGRALTQDRWLGIGASLSKPLKCGRWAVLLPFGYEMGVALRKPLLDLVRFRRPRGLRQAVYLLKGLVTGWRTRLDRRTLRFDS